jgi:hypothetical protein
MPYFITDLIFSRERFDRAYFRWGDACSYCDS